MSADFTIKQGDTAPVFTDTLTFSTGAAVNLTGASLAFVMRSLLATDDLTLTGAAAITNHASGAVKFAPSALDTATAGQFMANWMVMFADGSTMTFPTVGYLSVSVEENITSAGGQQLVSLPDAKEYLNIARGERDYDARLARFIRAARPTIENICGPIIPAVFDEWHCGGGSTVQIRRRPSSAPGTSPILDLLTADEYIGSTPHALAVVANPSLGSTYSCMIDSLGTVTRRTGGGGVGTFAQDVHITYRAGQTAVPENVYEGTLELLRVNWQTSRATGRGRGTVADDQTTSAPLHFYVPTKVAELLAPTRRHPSIA